MREIIGGRLRLTLGGVFMAAVVASAQVEVSNTEMGKIVAKAVESLEKWLEGADKIEEKGTKLSETLEKLSPLECVPALGGSEVMMPTSCGENVGSSGCECFDAAIEKLDRSKRALAREKCIYDDTVAFKEDAIKFGDTAASAAGLGGLAWTPQKRKIESTFNEFQKIANNKYEELMQGVESTLLDVNKCEAVLGEADWYRKFGFVYYELLGDRYRPRR